MDLSNHPILDIPTLKDRLDGDKDLFFELVEIFAADFDEHKRLLHEAISKSDAATICSRAHTVKGALANLSAMKASAWAFELEKQGRHNQVSDSGKTFQELLKSIDEFNQRVNEVKAGKHWE
jgi:two-component system, sensor histidine kinase and response regulator